MRHALLSVALFVSACVADPVADQPDAGEPVASDAQPGPHPLAVSQCLELTASFCTAGDECGGEPYADCHARLSGWCESAQTYVTHTTLRSALMDLSRYECLPYEPYFQHPDPSGVAILDAMVRWAGE